MEPLKWPIYQVVPVKSYICGRAVIAGDAVSTAIYSSEILLRLFISIRRMDCLLIKVPELVPRLRFVFLLYRRPAEFDAPCFPVQRMPISSLPS